jgi:hypothetical protein
MSDQGESPPCCLLKKRESSLKLKEKRAFLVGCIGTLGSFIGLKIFPATAEHVISWLWVRVAVCVINNLFSGG